MKTKIAIGLFMLFSIVMCINAQQDNSKIIGTWKLVSYKLDNNQIILMPDSLQNIKLITQTTYSWVRYRTKDKVIKSSAGGTYICKGENYIENREFSLGNIGFAGKTHIYTIKVDDKNIIATGKILNNINIEEHWEKIETLQ